MPHDPVKSIHHVFNIRIRCTIFVFHVVREQRVAHDAWPLPTRLYQGDTPDEGRTDLAGSG